MKIEKKIIIMKFFIFLKNMKLFVLKIILKTQKIKFNNIFYK